MQPTRDEALMRAIRNGMTDAGIPIESSKGEWSRGTRDQFHLHRPAAHADLHVVFKQRHQGDRGTTQSGLVMAKSHPLKPATPATSI